MCASLLLAGPRAVRRVGTVEVMREFERRSQDYLKPQNQNIRENLINNLCQSLFVEMDRVVQAKNLVDGLIEFSDQSGGAVSLIEAIIHASVVSFVPIDVDFRESILLLRARRQLIKEYLELAIIDQGTPPFFVADLAFILRGGSTQEIMAVMAGIKQLKKVDKKADLERLRKQETPIQQVVKSIVEQMVHSILQREKSENLNDSRFCYREIFQVTLDTRQMSKLELILNKIRREDLSSLDLNGQNYLQLVSLFEQTSFLIRIKTKSLKDGRPLSPSEKEKFQEEIELLTLINQAIIKKQQDLLMDELFAN